MKRWLTGIEKEDLEKIKPDPILDSRDYGDVHVDLDDTSTARFRPANWSEQIGCILAEAIGYEVTFD